MADMKWRRSLLAVAVLCAATTAFAESRDDDHGIDESRYSVLSRLEATIAKKRSSSESSVSSEARESNESDDSSDSSESSESSSSSLSWSAPSSAGTTVATALVDHPGRLLASNCFQCHGTDGRNGGFDRLAGESVREIVGELNEMRAKYDEDEGIMRVHAFGYSDAQLNLLADYFANLSR